LGYNPRSPIYELGSYTGPAQPIRGSRSRYSSRPSRYSSVRGN
jgi:hypothetical protein